MNKKTIREVKSFENKKVFLTADYNVSMNDGKITNDKRINESLPTLEYLLSKKAKIIIASHLGRPKGEDKKYSMKPVAQRLAKLSRKKVHLIEKFWLYENIRKIDQISSQDIVMLDNIRYHVGEKQNDIEFSKYLASMADIFVNDAFGTSHRIHSSIVGIAEFIPGFAGLLLEKEVNMLEKALKRPDRPFVVIIGGAKTPEKISVIEKILDVADTVLLGGAIANTFLAAWGFGMGKSIVDYEMIEMARVVFWKTTKQHSALILPQDVIISDKERKKETKVYDYQNVPNDVTIYDIGPKTVAQFHQIIQEAKTIIWNGPMGLFEDKRFASGTQSILTSVASSSAFSIIGGGDTLTTIKSKDLINKIDHISTGGSAMLEYLKVGTLPGIDVLQSKN